MKNPFQVGDKAVAFRHSAHRTCDDPTKRVVGIYPQLGDVLVVSAVIGAGIAFINSTVIDEPTRTELGWHHGCFRKLEDIQADVRKTRTRQPHPVQI